MKTLNIKWRRLIEKGETCPRCKSTEEELNKATSKLKESLSLLNIEVVIKKEKLSKKEFENSPLDSNQIIINNRQLKDWIEGEVGESSCCDVCGSTDCRTVKLGGETYEAIPAYLIVKAGLFAAASQLEAENLSKKRNLSNSCCG